MLPHFCLNLMLNFDWYTADTGIKIAKPNISRSLFTAANPLVPCFGVRTYSRSLKKKLGIAYVKTNSQGRSRQLLLALQKRPVADLRMASHSRNNRIVTNFGTLGAFLY